MKLLYNLQKINFKKLFNVLLFLVTVFVLIAFCISNNNLATLIQIFPSLNLTWVIFACLFMLLFWIIDSRLIYLITSHIYPHKYKKRYAFKITMVGQYFNSISPFGVLGQPMQIIAMLRQGIGSGIAFSILVQKFLIYQTSLTFYSLLVVIFKYNYFRANIPNFMFLAIIGFITQSFVVFMIFMFSINKKFTTKIISFLFFTLSKLKLIKNPDKSIKNLNKQLSYYLECNKNMLSNKKNTVKLYFITFLQLTCLFSIPYLLYNAFNLHGQNIFNMISAQVFVNMISSYTPLPGAAGTSESCFVILFKLFFTSELVNQAMLLWRFITYYSCILFGAVFAGMERKKDKISINYNSLMDSVSS